MPGNVAEVDEHRFDAGHGSVGVRVDSVPGGEQEVQVAQSGQCANHGVGNRSAPDGGGDSVAENLGRLFGHRPVLTEERVEPQRIRVSRSGA